MTVTEDFRSTVARLYSAGSDDGELLPTVWSRACVAVLPVDAAGLSMTRDLRVPLGASDEMAAIAERLQTSLGEGPCLSAVAQMEPVIVDEETMAARWPMFTDELTRRTAFRSIVSLPLASGLPGRRVGALDLYLSGSPVPPEVVPDATEVAEVITEMLVASPSTVERSGTVVPVWLSGEAATRRLNVWLAVGMLIAHGGVSSSDALAMLRAYAYRAGDSLDDVAAFLTERHLDPADVLTSA